MNPAKVERDRVRQLTDLPNIGPAMAKDLALIGIRTPPQLDGKDPLALYEALCRTTGQRQDPCVLDVFMSITRFMGGEAPRPWWAFTAERKHRYGTTLGARAVARPSFAELYERVLVGPLFSPWADAWIDDLAVRPDDRLVDVACGTGIVARTARRRLGPAATVVGVDLNPQMLDVARRIEPRVDWREGNAAALPLAAGERFDVLVCQQGFQFFPDRGAAARQMHAALARDGRLGLSCWAADEALPVLHALRCVAERHLGRVDDRRHSVADADPIAALLRGHGFRDVSTARVTRDIRFSDGADFVRMNAMALVGMSTPAPSLTDEQRQRLVGDIVRDSSDIIRSNTDAKGFGFEMATHVVLARA